MKIFIGSSRESREQAETVARWLEENGHYPVPWFSPTVFIAGEYTLDRLLEIARTFDAAIIIFAEDDRVWYRHQFLKQARDNALVEYGLFAGALGPDRALICRCGKPKLPTDLDGIGYLEISEKTIHRAKEQFLHWVRALENRRPSPSHQHTNCIPIAADNREELEEQYRKQKYTASKIDIMGIALSGALSELANDSSDRLLKRVLHHNAQVRLVFLSPLSMYVAQRAVEDGDTLQQLQEALRQSLRDSMTIYYRFKTLYDREKEQGRIKPHTIGFLEIRITDFCPHFTIARTDQTIHWGVYTAATRGKHCAVLRVDSAQEALFRQLLQHFDKLWHIGLSDAPKDENYIVKCHSRLEPVLNDSIVQHILGPAPMAPAEAQQ